MKCRLQFPATLALLLILFSGAGMAVGEQISKSGIHPVDSYFANEVWAKVGERLCLKCHNAKGDASDSRFLLKDPMNDPAHRTELLQHNHAAFARMARMQKDGQSRLLVKITGGLDHGGEIVLKPDSTGYRILEQFVRRSDGNPAPARPHTPTITDADIGAFFDGLQMVSPQRLLRRVTLSLAARLPTEKEGAAVNAGGLAAMGGVLDQLMTEEAFYARLAEGFNDIFLTQGYNGNAEIVLSYDHFNKTRLWYQKYDLSAAGDENAQRKARYKLANDYRASIRREPLELIKYIVRNDRPFTELVTADYIMVSPYSARGYGIFEELREQFKDTNNPAEYIPTRLKALKSRNGKVQESATGYYPHAGIQGMFHYLRRYPSTETNRNRQRARMYFQHFLGIDIMALAPQVADASAVSAKFENPTMQASECVVCHKTVDPIAGLFQDYFNEDGYYKPRKGGWFTDMFGPGIESEKLPESDRWRALQWLGERTAKDPRFARAMVEHVYYIVTGRRVLLAPEDIDDPLFTPRRRAFDVQQQEIHRIADRFAVAKFNLKVAFKEWITSPLYQADGAAMAMSPDRRAELDDLGIVRLLSPEQVERKLVALFGAGWGRLVGRESPFKILYGGIDSKEVTERMSDPSGAMGAIQRMMANDMACKTVPKDFTLPRTERWLFPNVELNDTPGESAATDEKIRRAIVHLHEHILGREHSAKHPEVERTFGLFAGIVADARDRKGMDEREIYFCRGTDDQRVTDKTYTLRAWRAVVTYLLRQQDFLYE